MPVTTSRAVDLANDAIDEDVVTPVLVEEMAHLGFIDKPTERRLKNATKAGDASLFDEIHRLPVDDKPAALCLSGGGIRSATFSLGVLQAFAESGRLERFNYLSTVSGGGYIGSWLSSWLHHEKWNWGKVIPQLAEAPGSTPTASAIHRTSATPITRLRAYSNYLSPIVGLSMDSLSLVSIFIRNLLLNLLVWVPLIAVLMMLPRLYVAALMGPPATPGAPDMWAWGLLVVAAGLLTGGIAYIVADLPGARRRPGIPDVLPLPKDSKSYFALACFAPVAAAAVALSLASARIVPASDTSALSYFMGAGACIHLTGALLGSAWRKSRKMPWRGGLPPWLALGVVLIGGLGGGVLLWCIHQFIGLQTQDTAQTRLLYALAAVPFLMGCFWVTMALYAGIVSRWTSEDDREWWAKATAWWLYASIGWLLLFGLVLYVPPLLLEQLAKHLPNLPAAPQLGLVGTVLGLVTSAVGYWGKNSGDLKRKADGVIQAAGGKILDLLAAVVLLVALIGVCLAASNFFQTYGSQKTSAPAQNSAAPSATAAPAAASSSLAPMRAQDYRTTLTKTPWTVILASLAFCLALAWAVSALIGANIFSLHGMYGNRLVRAYLGAGREQRSPHWFTGFDPQDNVPLSALVQPKGEARSTRLFPVINIALNLVKPSTKRLSWQQRKACSFTATPLHCGADGVGFVKTDQYGSGQGMSLGRAFTISGAAASPNMGYHSSALVTLVMTFFNVRLGWWLPNPGPAGKKQWHRDGPGIGFWAMLNEAFGRTTDDRPTVYLSDGGHFDNLGLYEMVRRRCHRIVVVDCSADPEFKYADLLSVVRKIRIDFGIPIDLPTQLPGPGRDTPHSRMITGTIRYSARDGCDKSNDGTLYVLKPRVVGNEPPEILHYAKSDGPTKHPFPHQSTIDQFFDEDQFESYRTLGRLTAARSFPNAKDWPAPAPADTKDDKWPGPPLPTPESKQKGGLLSGLAGQVADLGQGAALATALTIGVAGTVVLKDAEIRLSEEDRKLLTRALPTIDKPTPPDSGASSAAPPDTTAYDKALLTLRQEVTALKLSVDELKKAPTTTPDDKDHTEITIKLTNLSEELVNLVRVNSHQQERGQIWKEKVELRLNELEKLTAKSKSTTTSEPSNKAVLDSLDRIKDQLRYLKDSVDKAAPHRFVRGQEGSTR